MVILNPIVNPDQRKGKQAQANKEWKHKVEFKAHIAQSSTGVSSNNVWVLDSG